MFYVRIAISMSLYPPQSSKKAPKWQLYQNSGD
eukprot:COSAG06_NODE_21149_length_767_cov_9.982036_1_plen_32_part_10